MNEGAHTNSIQYTPTAEIIQVTAALQLIQHQAHVQPSTHEQGIC